MPAISASDSNIVPKSAKIMDVTTFDQPTRIRLTQGAGFAVSQRSKADYTHSSKDSYATQLSKLHTACYAVSFSSPSNSISWLDKSSLSLVASIPNAHVDTITSIRCPPYLSTHLGKDVLVSSGKDGLVKGWDTRTIGDQQCVFQFDDKRGILSFDVSSDGISIAAGTELKGDEAHLMFWDVRNTSAPTHVSTSAHSDDITSISYHPHNSHLVLSASTDGLLCTTNSQEYDEDESSINVGNWGCSIAKAGWTGAHGSDLTKNVLASPSSTIMDVEDDTAAVKPGVWAHSDMQTLSTWTESLDLSTDFGDLRKPVLPSTWAGSEYFIDATWLGGGAHDILAWGSSSTGTGPGATGLGLWVGSNNGDVALLRVENSESWKLEKVLSGSHTDVVRSVLWDEETSMILTAGEDSRVSAWAVPRGGVIPSGTYGSNISSQRNDVIENDEMDIDSPRKGSSISVGSKRERDAEERVAVSKRVKSNNHLRSG